MRLALIIRLTIGKAYYENTFRVFHHSLPNNRRFSAVNLKPEYFPYDSIEVVQTLNEEIVVKGKHLCTVQVKIVFSKPRETTRSIVLIPKPIEVQANVYHTMLNLAEQITSQLRTLATVKDSN